MLEPERNSSSLLPRHHQIAVYSSSKQDQIDTASLVLSAANISHTVGRSPTDQWQIFVETTSSDQATTQIRAYFTENQEVAQNDIASDSFTPLFKVQSLLIGVCLTLFFAITGDWSPHAIWFQTGAIDSTAVIDAFEYNRLVTALTLHADIVHLLSNCFLGCFVMHYLFLNVGNGIGLAATLLSATTANYLNVLGHGPGHLSVGFSTAVFSVIGILSALNFRHHKFSQPARLLLPLMAGCALLAMLGSSGERTDFGAHFYGLVSGLGVGTLLGTHPVYHLRTVLWLQTILGIACYVIIGGSWLMAIG